LAERLPQRWPSSHPKWSEVAHDHPKGITVNIESIK
jgi:hypothetical protein